MNELLKKLTKLQILFVRDVERNTTFGCSTHRDIDRVLMDDKMTICYGEAVSKLRNKIEKYSKNKYLLESIQNLEIKIKESELSNLRYGLDPQKKFSDLEKDLCLYLEREKFKLLTNMITIKKAEELTGVKESTLKQACQQERLLNAEKIGNTWRVHLDEVTDYWKK